VAGTPITKKESELWALLQETGLDFSELPLIMTAQVVAPLLTMTVDALSQDRVGGNPTIPYIKLGRRVRYLRSDLIRYLLANRVGEKGTEVWVPRLSRKDEEDLRAQLDHALAESAALRRKVAEQVVRDTDAKLAALKQADDADEPF
jgi:hypothetical protein